ncbi:MAG TPA: NIPSNAP family protein [Verrucomicrobiae bacterium]|nr:NIPSNAP family protein [Verrucomicrobiae bacterium]
MNRRAFLSSGAGAAILAGAADAPKNAIIELRRIQLRNSPDNQRQRNAEFLREQLAAFQRGGAGPTGAWASSIAPAGPFLLTLVSYPSFGAIEQIHAKLAGDGAYQKALDAFNSQPGLNYERMESSILRAFDGYPAVVPPSNDGKRPARLFEVRTYESNNTSTLRRKVKMFNDGEIGAFQRAGGQPVFFGETIAGPNQPSLTYMLSYEDLAGRDKVWKAFGADPEWQKLRVTPGLSDAEIVSNISNYLVTPLPFSAIR